ncbi:MAG: hypothetical protein SAK29_08860 [Scytonema sp. PMC 1069.18]|nr:hypothetical protein [Scytonema sp. PMC 1069.18]MEC4884800.1 hypothetical protein [Scytonema sp. PMC 1070.18]
MTETQTTYIYKQLTCSDNSKLEPQTDLDASSNLPNRTVRSGALIFKAVGSVGKHIALYQVCMGEVEVGTIGMTVEGTWVNSISDNTYGTPYTAAATLVEKWGGQ